ncbi:MAG TPA: hypothetical protein VFO25_05845 [Candidatus Eremiobacteraceae bacterium]|nr:hypothetical protein [Candidatus Eremiobacteraceae bacterium]
MNEITAFRESIAGLPWKVCSRVLAAVLTSDEWSGERAHIVGRTGMHFVVAVRVVEAATDAARFRFIADSPDLRHPVMGRIDLHPEALTSTAVTVTLRANLDAEPPREHAIVREAVASLAEALCRTIVEAACVPAVDDREYAVTAQ